MKIPKRGYENLTSEKAYIIGVLCGDGYLPRGRVRLSNVKDIDFIDYFKEQIEQQYGLNVHIYRCKDHYFELVLSSILVYNDLIRYDQTKEGYKTKTWKIPLQIIESNKESIKIAFLRGFIDSEASISHNQLMIYSSNKEGLEQLQLLLKQVGVISYLYPYKLRILSISSKHYLTLFSEKIGFRIKRKKTTLLKLINRLKHVSIRDGTYEKALELRKRYCFTIPQIAKILNIKQRTIKGWLYEGLNPYSKRGRIALNITTI